MTAELTPITHRALEHKPADIAALKALLQAAINVELFTIPLYMGTLYSIHGMHEINAEGTAFYQGRQWPGAAPGRSTEPNAKAFNAIFSVFIEEMLHLQIASNLASSMGVTPNFNSAALQDNHFGWTCYGPDKTQIPHIVDLKDIVGSAHRTIQIKELDLEQIELFMVIEETEKKAHRRIKPKARSKYFPTVPFADWTEQKTEQDLPLFGSIGHLYLCLVQYMSIQYADASTLWDAVYTPGSIQRDLFNTQGDKKHHPEKEYPGFAAALENEPSARDAFAAAIDMIDAITDQGEGNDVGVSIRKLLWTAKVWHYRGRVDRDYQSDEEALEHDYPSYDASGQKMGYSEDATARYENDKVDHYERFARVRHLVRRGKIRTWSRWHEERGAQPWKEQDLLTGGPLSTSSKIPSAQDVATALNTLKDSHFTEREKVEKDSAKQAPTSSGTTSVHAQLSQVATGAIAGVTGAMNQYWSGKTDQFPFPSMSGSGDRMALCWAVLGQAPDLSQGLPPSTTGKLSHACQGLDFESPTQGGMPDISTYHTCRGSNACKGQGGCGFVQSASGGGACGSAQGARASGGSDTPTQYSAPGDNNCRGLGGCAVPISASQLFAKSGTMQLYNLVDPDKTPGTLDFKVGDSVYDTAWEAYSLVLKPSGQQPVKPTADTLRVALTPST